MVQHVGQQESVNDIISSNFALPVPHWQTCRLSLIARDVHTFALHVMPSHSRFYMEFHACMHVCIYLYSPYGDQSKISLAAVVGGWQVCSASVQMYLMHRELRTRTKPYNHIAYGLVTRVGTALLAPMLITGSPCLLTGKRRQGLRDNARASSR